MRDFGTMRDFGVRDFGATGVQDTPKLSVFNMYDMGMCDPIKAHSNNEGAPPFLPILGEITI